VCLKQQAVTVIQGTGYFIKKVSYCTTELDKQTVTVRITFKISVLTLPLLYIHHLSGK